MDSYVGCGDPEEKPKMFQVKLCLVTPWKYIQGVEDLDILDMRRRTLFFFLTEHLAQVEHEMLLK